MKSLILNISCSQLPAPVVEQYALPQLLLILAIPAKDITPEALTIAITLKNKIELKLTTVSSHWHSDVIVSVNNFDIIENALAMSTSTPSKLNVVWNHVLGEAAKDETGETMKQLWLQIIGFFFILLLLFNFSFQNRQIFHLINQKNLDGIDGNSLGSLFFANKYR